MAKPITANYATPERYEPGSHLMVFEAGNEPVLHRVIRRVRGGYKVKSPKEAEPNTLTDDQINDLRLAKRLDYFPCDLDLAPDHIKAALSNVWDSFPETQRTIALRRQFYCKEVDVLNSEGRLLEKCYPSAKESVFERHRQEWRDEDLQIAAREAERQRARRRKPVSQLESQDEQELKPPSPATIETWYTLWVKFGRDIRVLIPDFSGRGNHNNRYDQDLIYKDMRECLENYYFIPEGPDLTYAYRKFEKLCNSRGLFIEEGKPRAYPTYAAFRNYKNKISDDYYECKRRKDSRTAYLQFTCFGRAPKPSIVLAEVEIDHCLVDLIVLHDKWGTPIGRPWVTALLDRASRMILGMHVSFEVPSYAAVNRCLGHSFWPKDLSGIQGLENPWPSKGIPHFIFMDNGREFHSKSLRLSEQTMHFRLQPLPVASPWLKGCLERLFGTMHTQVYGHKPGKTFANAIARGQYKSVNRAETSFTEFKHDLLKWVVNDYHGDKHAALECAPLQRYAELVEIQGGVRPPPRFDQVIEMIGEVTYRPIQNDGIHIEGLEYSSPALSPLLKDRGGRAKKHLCRFDPFDMHEIRVLDDVRQPKVYIPVECTNPEISSGVSLAMAKLQLKLAKQSAGSGKVTELDLLKSRSRIEAERDAILSNGKAIGGAKRAARYDTVNGTYFTPILDENATPQLAAGLSDLTPQQALPSQEQVRTAPPGPVAPAAKSGQDDVAEILRISQEWISNEAIC
ncbi:MULTISPECIES: Mu transposase C-terminal domain-containing protein [unclassified Bradyrhizobium]